MFVPFKQEHVRQIAAQESQRYLAPFIEGVDLSGLENKWSHTFLREGRAIACFGATVIGPSNGEVWAYFDEAVGPHLLRITREARRLILASDFRRLQAVIFAKSEEGHRWVRALGFELEAPRLRRYFTSGEDAALYGWVRG